MGLVGEMRELGQLVDAHPGNRFATRRVLVDLADLGVVLRPDDLVAAHAALHGRQAGILRAPRVGVTVLALDAERAGMDHVIEEDRLLRRTGHDDQRRGLLGPERRPGQGAYVRDDLTYLIVAELAAEPRHRGCEPPGRATIHDDAREELVGQAVHEPAVGQIGRLGSEAGSRRSVTPTAVSVADGALPRVEFATGRHVALGVARGRHARGGHGRTDEEGARSRGEEPANHAALPLCVYSRIWRSRRWR